MAPFRFSEPPRRRRPGLTALIDVVFILLVFFMLASRFGPETGLLASPVPGWVPDTPSASATGPRAADPPRIVDIAPGGVALNGAAIDPAALAPALEGLMQAPDDPVILRVADGVSLQELVDLMGLLRAAGIEGLHLLEAAP